MEDINSIDINSIPKRFHKIAQFLKENPDQFDKLDPQSKDFFKYLYETTAKKHKLKIRPTLETVIKPKPITKTHN